MNEMNINVQLSPLALKLRRLRIDKGRSLEQAALELGIEVVRLLYWEMDKATPSKKELKKLAKYYEINFKLLESIQKRQGN